MLLRPLETVAILLLPLVPVFLALDYRFGAAALYILSYVLAAAAGGIVRILFRRARLIQTAGRRNLITMAILLLFCCVAVGVSYLATRGAGTIALGNGHVLIWPLAMGAGFVAGLLASGRQAPHPTED
ncbi:hypothetical protein ACT6QH_08295 [Xanthobacter sp. TB0139]|uniref:hypothetical protein n=1 Tax=Xanthobacter sp. TB0139 TaxID=3459178 RepID=UPI0040393193